MIFGIRYRNLRDAVPGQSGEWGEYVDDFRTFLLIQPDLTCLELVPALALSL